MGQKVHPLGFRLGVYKSWFSRWFARDSYGKQLLEDLAIRKLLKSELSRAEVSRVEIEKAGDNVRIIINSGRPGMVIGKKGKGIEDIRAKLAEKIKRNNIEISVNEIKNPELDAQLMAQAIAEQIERRVSHKKAMKRAAASSMRAGAKGVKICCSGRLHGAEIARTEWTRIGSLPLHTLRSDIDYGFAEAHTTYGVTGVKVWICRGDYQHG
ncbi:30S ribosomal protein S3 [Candidatus Dependentiae bacterium]